MDSIVPTIDFWSRQANAQRYVLRFEALGTPVEITANSEDIWAAARLAGRRYSRAESTTTDPSRMRIQVIRCAAATSPLPVDWPEQLRYAGTGDWITLSAGEWGYGVGHLAARSALVVLTPAIAAEAQLVSRYFLDHYVLNFLFSDWAMLHASAALDPAGQGLVVVVGDHNIGKSTTALRLLRAGWRFLADGMVLTQQRGGRLIFGGYPIGEVKLRDDVLAAFPEYAEASQAARVREQRKTVVDLRAIHPEQVAEALASPSVIHLCFTERGAEARTRVRPMDREAAQGWVAAHTVYWDEPARLARNAHALDQLLDTAHLHHLTLGLDPSDLIASLEKLR